MTLFVKKLNGDAKIPTRGSPLAAGYDMCSVTDTWIAPGMRAVIPTGIAFTVPEGTYGRVAPRSGLAVKKGIQVGAGVIDRDYTGEVKVVLFNQGDETFEIKKGDRIAQLILERCETPEIQLVTDLEDTERSSGGFGSTGV
jgi:dUTP pyrophosphatase